MRIANGWLLALFLLGGSGPAGAQAPKPSFDCVKAKTDVERAICADPKLATLDVAVAKAYASALKRLEPRGAKSLRDDQRSFQAVLSFGMEHNEDKPKEKQIFDLAESLGERVKFLAGVTSRPIDRWEGTWSNHFGGIDIKRAPAGRLKVEVNAAMPVTGNWVCSLEGEATPDAGRLSVRSEEDGKPDGWTYHLMRDGDQIVLSQEGPKGQRYGSPLCGHNGSMEGNYLPTAPEPDAPGAIAPQRNR